MTAVDHPNAPDPERINELRNLRHLAPQGLASRSDLMALQAEIEKALSYYQAVLQGQQNVSADLSVSKLDTGMTYGGALVAAAGVATFVLAPPAGMLLWLGGVCTAGGAITGGFGLFGLKKQKDKINKWKEINDAIQTTVAELQGSLEAVKHATGKDT
jgi:hypothetical protein